MNGPHHSLRVRTPRPPGPDPHTVLIMAVHISLPAKQNIPRAGFYRSAFVTVDCDYTLLLSAELYRNEG